MASIDNLVHETTSGTGTGNLTLANVNGKQSFSDAFGTGATQDVFYYFISNRSAAEWEVGTGHMSDATTLVRDTVIASSNSDAAVDFTAGTKNVANDIPAEHITSQARAVLDDTSYNAMLTTITATRSETDAVAVPVLNKLRETMSVEDFGAVGDGTTDDTDAIQAALDVLKSTGGTLHFQNSTYLVSSCDLTACVISVELIGKGGVGGTAPQGTILLATAQSGTARPVLDMTGSSYVKISNITIRSYTGSYVEPSVVPTCGFLLSSSGTLLNSNKNALYDCATDGFFSVAALGIGSSVNNIYVGGQYINQAVAGAAVYAGTANGKTWNTHHADGSSNQAVTNENLFFGVEAHARTLDTTGTGPALEINTADTLLWLGMPLSCSGATASYIEASGTLNNCRFEPAKYYSEGGGDPVHILDLQDSATMTRCHFAGYDYSTVTGTAFNGGAGATAVDCTLIGFDDATFTGNIISGFSAFGSITAVNGASIDTSYPAKLQVGGKALLTATGPDLGFKKTDAGSDEKYWDFTVGATTFAGRAGNDAFNSANNWLQVTRSGTTISGVAFPSGPVGLGTGAISTAWTAMPASTTAKAHANLAGGVAPTSPNDGDVWFDGDDLYLRANSVSYPLVKEETFGIALSDETTAITTGTNKATFSLPYAFTITSVYATLNTASTSGAVTVDINEAGTTILSTKLTIDQDEKTSATAATAAVISDAAIAANAELGFDIDGAGTGAKGLKVFITGYRT